MTMMFGNGFVTLIWLLNLIFGNNGGIMHMVWWRVTQAVLGLFIIELALMNWAKESYGTKN